MPERVPERMSVTADMLMAGAEAVETVTLPARLVPRGGADPTVRLRPLTVRDLRLIAKAAREGEEMAGALMVRQALVEPALSLEEIGAMPAGLLQHLLAEVNRISGLTATDAELVAAMQDPLVAASLRLSRELGWTPAEIAGLSMGEVMLHIAALRAGG